MLYHYTLIPDFVPVLNRKVSETLCDKVFRTLVVAEAGLEHATSRL